MKRKLPRFTRLKLSLKYWLLLFSIVCIWLGCYIIRAKSQQECVAEILQNSGGVIYSHRYTNGKYNPAPKLPGPGFIRNWLGMDYVDHVINVDFNHQPIAQLPDLHRLPRLKSLWIYDTSVADLSPASKLKHLESLWVQESSVRNLEPIASLKNLKWVNISATGVTDLTPLFNLPKLETLIVSGTEIDPDHIEEFRMNQPKCQVAE